MFNDEQPELATDWQHHVARGLLFATMSDEPTFDPQGTIAPAQASTVSDGSFSDMDDLLAQLRMAPRAVLIEEAAHACLRAIPPLRREQFLMSLLNLTQSQIKNDDPHRSNRRRC